VLKRKARFTPRGFVQRLGLDYNETFAPVAKMTTLRIFLALVAILKLHTRQMDVKTAFLNASVDEELYCEPVPDLVHLMKILVKRCKENPSSQLLRKQISDLKNGCVLRIHKALYGLKQAPRNWFLMIDKYLKESGFVSNMSDTCLYSKVTGENFLILLLYVDDILIAGNHNL
jgi:hypothetical protein